MCRRDRYRQHEKTDTCSFARTREQDAYRTKMPEKSKPTLTGLTIVGAPDGIDDAFVAADAITRGLDLTRTLVTDDHGG